MTSNKDIDSFVATFPEVTQKNLQQVRETIQKAAPEAEEAMSYGIPTFKLKGNLVHFFRLQKSYWFLSRGFRY